MARIKIENQYGPGEAADDIFRAFLQYSANARLAMEKDEQQYFTNLSNLVGQSAQYNGTTLDGTKGGTTDWKFLEEELKEAWQHLVDTGLAWSLQGRFGRIAHAMIENGDIKAPKGWKYDIDTIG